MDAINEVKTKTALDCINEHYQKSILTGRGEGQRKNAGKLRYDLTPAFAQQEYVRVLTAGSIKYEDNNWKRGMTWSSVMASMKRHIAAFESGEDIDEETQCYHTAQIMCNAAFLTEFYKIFPSGDDRQHRYLTSKRIGLDIDEVLADFVGGYMKYFYITEIPEFWNFDSKIVQRLIDLPEYFWAELMPKVNPSEWTFEPTCYITNRPIASAVTSKWLADHRFPAVPVFTTKSADEKIEIARDCKLDIFVDDRYETFVKMNSAGICCYLMDAAHNRRYNVGHKRITHLRQLTS